MSKIRIEDADKILSELAALPKVEPPPTTELTTQSFILRGAKTIHALVNRGYTLKQVSEFLRAKGIAVSPLTLRNYLQRANGTKPKQKPKKAKPEKPILETTSSKIEAKPTPAETLTLAEMKEIPRRSAFEVKPDEAI